MGYVVYNRLTKPREGHTTMGQDNTPENDYGTGYGGYGRYTSPQQPGQADSASSTS